MTTIAQNDRFIDTKELKHITSLQGSSITNYIKNGIFRRIKVGGKTVFLESEIRAWMQDRLNATSSDQV